jgi:hypothetical protein
MSWAGLANNQWVSFTNAQGCGYSPKQALPTSNEWMTRADVINYFNCNTAYLPATSTEWVTKQELYNAISISSGNDSITLNPSVYNAAPGGETYVITITSNYDSYTISTVMGIAIIEPNYSTYGNGTVSITMTANNTGSPRTDFITFYHGETNITTARVNQDSL